MSEYKAVLQRTESMNKLSIELQSLVDCALQVNDAIHDVTSRASRLDTMSSDTLQVISDSTRLAAVFNALCSQQPSYARFLWSAARNLVRDVIGHVTSTTDLHPGRVKVSDDENEAGIDGTRRQSRRAVAELELFRCNDAHLDYADWLEAVATSRHDQSPNHDLCCRLLSHIPLLAAYTGWPTENHLHLQPGTQPLQTSDVFKTAGLGLPYETTNWRPAEEEKKFIEETVRSLVDSQDLCRLLMIALATELQRPIIDTEEPVSKSESLAGGVKYSFIDHNHGDKNDNMQPNKLDDFWAVETNSLVLDDPGKQLMEKVGCGLESAYDSDEGKAEGGEDGMCNSLETGSFCAQSSTNFILPMTGIPLQDYYCDELVEEELVLSSRKICSDPSACLPGRFLSSKTLDVELADAIKDATVSECEQAKPFSPDHISDAAQIPDDRNNAGLSEEWSSTQSFRADPEHSSATDATPANIHTQSQTEPAANCVSNNSEKIEKTDTISTTESSHWTNSVAKSKKSADNCDQNNSVKAELDFKSREDVNLMYADAGETVKTGLQDEQRVVQLEDKCKVIFRPRRSAIPRPIRTLNHAALTPAALAHSAYLMHQRAPLSAAGLRATGSVSGRPCHRPPKSNSQDVKTSARRKTVAV